MEYSFKKKISEQAPFMVMNVLVIFSIKSCVERHIWIITRGDLAISCIYSTNEVKHLSASVRFHKAARKKCPKNKACLMFIESSSYI